MATFVYSLCATIIVADFVGQSKKWSMAKKGKKASRSGTDIEEPLPETIERSALVSGNASTALPGESSSIDFDEFELDAEAMGSAINDALADAEEALARTGPAVEDGEVSEDRDLPVIEDLFLLDDESDAVLAAPGSSDDDVETLEGRAVVPLSGLAREPETSEASEFAVPPALLQKIRSESGNDTNAETREVRPLGASPSDETVQNAISKPSQAPSDNGGRDDGPAWSDAADRSYQTLDVPLEAIQVSEVFQDPGINIMPSFDEGPSESSAGDDEVGGPAEASGPTAVSSESEGLSGENEPFSIVFDAIVSQEGSVLIPPEALDEGALATGHLVRVTLTKLSKTRE
jgi:hypothetical protein